MSIISTRRRAIVRTLAALVGFTAAGCAANVTDPSAEEALGTDRQAANPLFFQTTWFKGDPSFIDVAPIDDFWCALTGVSGIFRGFGEDLRVFGNHQRLTPTWELHGKSNQNGTTGTVTCYRRSDFIGVGSSNIISPEFQVQDYGGDCPPWPLACGTSPPQPTLATVWQGDAVTMLTGMAGDFRGSGEFIEVRQALTGSASSKIAAQSDVDEDYTKIRAHSFFVGTPGAGRAARFIGPGGLRGTANVGEFEAGGVTGMSRVRMASRNEAFCYLTHVGGAFSKADNSVNIETDEFGFWTLAVNSPGSSRAKARARCMLLDQRDPILTFPVDTVDIGPLAP
jgi:hypothetical protein